MVEQEKVKTEPITLGIDLGTTNTFIGYYIDDRIQILQSEVGLKNFPSYVAFTEEEILIGESARKQIGKNPKNTIYDFKRLLGSKYSDKEVQENIKGWPFKIEQGPNDKPVIMVHQKGEKKIFSPQEITTIFFQKIKEIAQKLLQNPVKNALLTAPASYNDQERAMLKKAGQDAGLNVLRIINEPTSAAISLKLDQKTMDPINYFIFDLGGGTYNLSILAIQDGIYQILATTRNNRFGGKNFDSELFDYCKSAFKKETGIDISDKPQAVSRLQRVCEQAKCQLSYSVSTLIKCEALAEGLDFQMNICRGKFEQLCQNLFKELLFPLHEVFKDCIATKNEIKGVYMVGGSSRIPKVKAILKNFFEGKQIMHSVNPDQEIAKGATKQGGILSGSIPDKYDFMCVFDVTPLSMGIEVEGGIMKTIMKRNCTIPCKKSQVMEFISNEKGEIQIKIFQGERPLTKQNNHIGTLNFRTTPVGIHQIQVIFDLDANSLLHVTARDVETGEYQKIIISNENYRLTADEIRIMIQESQKFKEEDQRAVKMIKQSQNK